MRAVRSRGWVAGVVVGAAVVIWGEPACASERSQILTAKGELAYHQGRREEARALLSEAVAADPEDALAHLALGQVQLALGDREGAKASFTRAKALQPDLLEAERGIERASRVGGPFDAERITGTVGEIGRLASVRAPETQRWGLRFSTGFQYDTNVTLEPLGVAGEGFGKKNDGSFVVDVGGHYDVVSRPDFLFRLEYDFYQTLHFDLDEYDFRSQQVQGTMSYAVRPSVWVGTQGGYNYYTLGTETYLGEPFVMPFVSIVEGTWGLTQLNYRHGDSTYFSTPFNDVRDGPTESTGIRQDLFFANGRYVTVGYQFTNEDPSATSGVDGPVGFKGQPQPKDYQMNANEVFVGGGLPLVWGLYTDLQYLYRNDNYLRPNSYSPTRKKRRQDDGHFIYVGVSRPIMPHVSLAIAYYGTFNLSNLDVFEYNRHVVATLIQVTY